MNIRFKNIILSIVLLLCFLILSSCEDKIENKEVEVTIIRVFNTGRHSPQGDSGPNDIHIKRANVRYIVKNIDTETITGWKVYFNVATDVGPQMSVGGRFACTLEPGETSNEKIASSIISAGTGDPISATVDLV